MLTNTCTNILYVDLLHYHFAIWGGGIWLFGDFEVFCTCTVYNISSTQRYNKWLTWTQKSLKKLWKVIFHTIFVEEAVVCVNGRHMSGILCQSMLAGCWHVGRFIARMIKTWDDNTSLIFVPGLYNNKQCIMCLHVKEQLSISGFKHL